MSEPLETINKDYLKGFNEGYILGKYDPDLAKQISKAMVATDRANGLKDGIDQYDIETQDRFPEWLKKDRLQDLNSRPAKTKDQTRDGRE